MFDVCPLTVVDLRGAAVRPFLRRLLANDVDKLKAGGKALYSLHVTKPMAGLISDRLFSRQMTGSRMVVNAATTDKDLAWILRAGQGV